jgi:hypothetical protein
MKSQTRARYLYRAKNRLNEAFIGLVLVANPTARKSTKLASGARKRVNHVRVS